MAIHQVTIAELKGILPGGGALIDVREPEEYEAGHIAGSTNIPLSTLADNVERFKDEFDVYLVCNSGRKSLSACEFLHDRDVDNVVNVASGVLGWVAAGGVLKLGDQP